MIAHLPSWNSVSGYLSRTRLFTRLLTWYVTVPRTVGTNPGAISQPKYSTGMKIVDGEKDFIFLNLYSHHMKSGSYPTRNRAVK